MLVNSRVLIKILSLCIAFMLIAGALATVSVFAQELNSQKANGTSSGDPDEIVEELPDSVFYGTREIDAMSANGYRSSTATTVVDDDMGFQALRMTVAKEGIDPFQTFVLPDEISTSEYPFVAYFIRKNTTSLQMQTFFVSEESEKYIEKNSKKANYKPNNKWQIMVFELSDLSLGGNLEQFRIDYVPGGAYTVGEYCEIAGVAFGKTEDDAIRPICDFISQRDAVVYHFSEFSDAEKSYIAEWSANTSVKLQNGNIIYSHHGRSGGNDSMSLWNIEEHLKYLGAPQFDTRDFNSMVIKFKAHIKDGMPQRFEIFYQTNGRTDAVAVCSTVGEYRADDTWQGMRFDFGDRPEWTGDLHSFRIDWSDDIPNGSYGCMKISDIYLFRDSKTAEAVNKIINNITVVRNDIDPDITEGTTEEITYETIPWQSETIGFITDETYSVESSEETSEETLPPFIETTEEITEPTTDETGEQLTEGSEITEEGSEKSEDTGKTDHPKGETDKLPQVPGADGNIDDLIGNEDKDKGSEVPFHIACAVLAMLSVLSIATVFVVRVKNKP